MRYECVTVITTRFIKYTFTPIPLSPFRVDSFLNTQIKRSVTKKYIVKKTSIATLCVFCYIKGLPYYRNNCFKHERCSSLHYNHNEPSSKFGNSLLLPISSLLSHSFHFLAPTGSKERSIDFISAQQVLSITFLTQSLDYLHRSVNEAKGKKWKSSIDAPKAKTNVQAVNFEIGEIQSSSGRKLKFQ